MYRGMLLFLIVLFGIALALSALGFLQHSPRVIALQATLFVFLCWGVNKVAARLVGVVPNKESALITGLILSLIAGPLVLPQEWPVLVVMAIAAMGSKYLIAPHHRHVFNPAAFGIVVSALVLGSPASWWVGASALFPFVLVGGGLGVLRIRRAGLAGSFLAVYGILTVLFMVGQGGDIAEAVSSLWRLALASPVLFFAFVMVVEPLTSPQTPRRRIWFGVTVAAALFVVQILLPQISYSFGLALLIGNIAARFMSPGVRQTMELTRREELTPDIESFWFRPARSITFTPGQFLEYTLPHASSDSRGIRRFFTIASSPSEEQMLLTTRFAEEGSTFKKALRALQPGGEVAVSPPQGDFVLPKGTEKLLLIAGGIGITPYRSMARHLLDTEERRDIVLLYGAKNADDVVFRDVFEQAYDRLGIAVHYILEDEQGYITDDIIRTEAPDFRERLVYVSGPEGMVKAMEKALGDMGVSRGRIKRDYFPGYDEQKQARS